MLGNKSRSKHYRSGGTRGGAASFDWNDVKYDAQRQNYLGHSEMAPVGRWQKGRDILWYTRATQDQQLSLEEERELVRKNDKALIEEALGLRPKRQKTFSDIDRDELKSFLSRGGTERGSENAERIQGLGAAPAKHHENAERFSLIEKQIIELKGGTVEKPVVDAPLSSSDYRNNISTYPRGGHDVLDRRERDRVEKDRKKAEKKERKREKKEQKKEKKEQKKERRRERDKRDSPIYETY